MDWLLARFPRRPDARIRTRARRASFGAVYAVLFAAAMTIAACSAGGGAGGGPLGGLGSFGGPSPQQKAQDTELMLAAAGFRPIAPATTDSNQLASLPALTMNYYVNNDGQARYWYADSSYCHCLYLGDTAAYQRYQNLALQNQMLENQQQVQIQRQQMQQQQMMGPPMMGPPMMGPPVGFGIGGPGVGIIF